MTNPSLPRARRIAGAVLVVATLGAERGDGRAERAGAAAPAPAATNVVGLRKGARGDAVKALQEALVRVGIGVKYGVDSYFGSATRGVGQGVPADQGPLRSPASSMPPRPRRSASPRRPPRPAPRPRPATDLLGRGSTGPLVAQVQQALINFGFPIASGADGVFGASTERALKAFQKANGLGVSGRTYPSTMRALGVVAVAAAAPAARPPPPAGRRRPTCSARGSTGTVVVQVQQALIKLGFPVAADGVFGATTERALMAFQRANGLGVSGRTYPATMRALGVTAAAPPPLRPPPPRRPHRAPTRRRASPPTTNVAPGSWRCSRR